MVAHHDGRVNRVATHTTRVDDRLRGISAVVDERDENENHEDNGGYDDNDDHNVVDDMVLVMIFDDGVGL